MTDTSGKIRVLIADDHGMILDVLSMFLATQPDMHVTTTTDLDGALSAITANGGYDVVLLDYNMPGMNGTQGLVRAIQLNKKNQRRKKKSLLNKKNKNLQNLPMRRKRRQIKKNQPVIAMTPKP